MNEQERTIADRLYAGLQALSNFSARTLQAKEFQVGVSDLGFCSERVRRSIDRQVEPDTDKLKALIGTALGDYMERAAMAVWPEAVTQATINVLLSGERREYELSGHPDIILPEQGIVLDGKTDYGLNTVRRTGPSLQQQFQRNLYGLGAWNAGFFGDRPLSEVQVGNVWLDRAGIEQELHVQMEPYSEDLTHDAATWLDDVVYAYLNGEEARKEPPREMCAVVCGFYEVCRAWDTDVEGLLTDKTVLESVSMHREGGDLVKRGKKLQDEAKVHLKGITGSTGEFNIRWTHVNDSVVPEQHRRGYDKLDIRPLPRPKAEK